MSHHQSSAIIDEFVAYYKQVKSHFKFLAETVETKCRDAIDEAGIRCIVTSRAKHEESLHDKLLRRQERRGPYPDRLAIYEDIVDLAGVRVAVYDWSEDRVRVETVLSRILEIYPDDGDGDGVDEDCHHDGAGDTNCYYYTAYLRAADRKALRMGGDDPVEIQVVGVAAANKHFEESTS